MWRRKKPPIRMINIARCFRRNFDVTHTPMFHQFEGLCVDKNINIKHLKGTIAFFVREYFGYETKIRLRPHHFQFTEPSFEVDTTCTVCKGQGVVNGQKCRVCKSGWLELGGCGMVHPQVLAEGKINSEIYSGWAFGFGIERVLMMKYQLSDIRKLYSGEIELYKKN
jgi:phenylalanyl-tRNA synthetase alpha chain